MIVRGAEWRLNKKDELCKTVVSTKCRQRVKGEKMEQGKLRGWPGCNMMKVGAWRLKVLAFETRLVVQVSRKVLSQQALIFWLPCTWAN
jgi:hypothetical protein